MRDDAALDELTRCTQSVGERMGIEVLAAREGLTIEI
jgi:hypothetical protein